jgi:hypothetical protein
LIVVGFPVACLTRGERRRYTFAIASFKLLDFAAGAARKILLNVRSAGDCGALSPRLFRES